MKISLYIFVLYIHTCYTLTPELDKQDRISASIMLNITEDIIKDTNRRIGQLLDEQKEASGCAAFEVGYLTYVIHEKYRRMVDKYNVSAYMTRRLYLTELILYLEEIERHYWEINHISNMLHEVERKYHVTPDLNVEYEESTPEPEPTAPGEEEEEEWKHEDRKRPDRHNTKKRTRFKMNKYLENQLTSTMRSWTKKRHKWWSMDYGWESKDQWWL